MIDFTAVAIRFWRDESGSHAIEYALLVALVAIVAVVGGQTLGEGLSAMLFKVNGAVHTAITSIGYSGA